VGISKDQKLAEKWLTKAASHAEELKQVGPAANALGSLYETGLESGKPDYDKAINWYQKAADLNYAKAETNLGMLYHMDLAGKRDLVTAYMWFRLASAQDEPGAIHMISNILDTHELTDTQMAEGDKRAKDFLAAHNLKNFLPAPKHLMTPESLMLQEALQKKAEQQKQAKLKQALEQRAAQTNAAPNPAAPTADTGTK
jgi:TPR repeat protein